MFYKADDNGYRQALPGVRMKTLIYGDKTLLAEFRLAANHALPRHAHIYEQTGYLASGRLRFTIGDNTMELAPGDSWCVPGDVEHSVEILEDAVVVEVFSPVREDYLPPKA